MKFKAFINLIRMRGDRFCHGSQLDRHLVCVCVWFVCVVCGCGLFLCVLCECLCVVGVFVCGVCVFMCVRACVWCVSGVCV